VTLGQVTARRSPVMELVEAARLIERGGVLVLSGAGLSTESGIPDYRGPTGATLRRHAPMTFQAFVRDPVARRRYWARSHLGWRHIAQAQPNAGHLAVADLERAGVVTGVITQNVDGLHQAAGSNDVIDLHGRLDRVVCLSCGALSDRRHLDVRLRAANVDWRGQALTTNPDGDVELADVHLDQFTVVDCEICGGVLKPDVVYFGENVPRERVELAYSWVDAAGVLLVLGSSLHVFSGRRFVMRAAGAGTPVVIVNQGPTRGDEVAAVKVDAALGETLAAIAGGVGEARIGSRA
jgi:NAD-dependent SIR2 family protein deacetylase